MSNPSHGGRRKGAGRRPDGESAKAKASIALAPALLAALDAEANTRGTSRSAVIEDAARRLLGLEAAQPATRIPDVAARAWALQQATAKAKALAALDPSQLAITVAATRAALGDLEAEARRREP